MGHIMEKLIEYYQRYQSIMDSYRGEKTDWESACCQLLQLRKEIYETKIRYGKNSLFYNWVKRNLYNEVDEERRRVEMIIVRRGLK